MHLFGKAKKKPTPNEAIERLRATVDMLGKRQAYLQKKSDDEALYAKQHAQSNRRAALFALKKRKVYENQIEKLNGARMTIETQILHLEQSTTTKEAMEAMRDGADAMKQVHGDLTIDKVEDTMEDIREQMDIANEMTDAISRPVGFGMDFDDDELAQELDELSAQSLDEKLLGTGELMPTAPVGVPTRAAAASTPAVAAAATQPAESADEAALRQLAEEMA